MNMKQATDRRNIYLAKNIEALMETCEEDAKAQRIQKVANDLQAVEKEAAEEVPAESVSLGNLVKNIISDKRK